MFHVVIPARFASTRLPGKPLATIAGKPLVQWAWESARDSGAASAIVATDDERVHDTAVGFGAECMMTSAAHASGTDRIAEVARARGFAASDVIVNLQGDEPLVPATLLARLARALLDRPAMQMASVVAPFASVAEFLDPNCVKAVRTLDGRALYFSRAPVPWPRDDAADGRPGSAPHAWRHIGIYAYRVQSLLELSALAPSPLERTEKLEQLRALEHGMSIYLLALEAGPPAGVDSAADLERVRRLAASHP